MGRKREMSSEGSCVTKIMISGRGLNRLWFDFSSSDSVRQKSNCLSGRGKGPIWQRDRMQEDTIRRKERKISLSNPALSLYVKRFLQNELINYATSATPNFPRICKSDSNVAVADCTWVIQYRITSASAGWFLVLLLPWFIYLPPLFLFFTRKSHCNDQLSDKLIYRISLCNWTASARYKWKRTQTYTTNTRHIHTQCDEKKATFHVHTYVR